MLRPLESVAGTWPTLRHDERLTGHQPLPGMIRSPAVRWLTRLAGPHYDGMLIEAGGGADLLLPFGGCLHRYDALGALVWRSPCLGIESIVGIEDLDGDGTVEILATDGKSLSVLDAHTGRVLWRTWLGPPTSGGFMSTAARTFRDARVGPGAQLAVGLLSSQEVLLYDFSPGADRPRLRHRLSMPDFFHPSVLVTDVDGDGAPELVVTKLSSVYIFDTHSGELRSECRWASGGTPKRNYGYLMAVDLAGSRVPSFVAISDRVSRHIAVVVNDGGGGLSLAWDRFIEHIYEADTTELRAAPGSCVDIDGDGRVEIVVSVYNESGDGRWWLEAIEASTGETRWREPDWYLRGIDADREGGPLLFVSRERTRVPESVGEIAVMQVSGDRLEPLFAMPRASFVGCFAERDQRRAQFRTDLPPSDDVWRPWVNERPHVAVTTPADGLILLDEDGVSRPIRTGMRCPESIIAVGDMDGDGVTELVLGDCDGSVWVAQPDGTVLSRIHGGLRLRPGTGPYYGARPTPVPIVFDVGAERVCAVPDAGGSIHVVRSTPNGPVDVARHPGRGRIGPEEVHHSVVAVDLDGTPVILFAPLGPAAIAAVDLDGNERARWRLPWLPPTESTPVARTGVHEFAPLDELLVVSGFASSSMNSEITAAMDLATAEVRWTGQGIDVPGHVLANAPWNALSVDRASGAARLLFLAKDTVCELDAQSGLRVHDPWQLRPYNRAAFDERGYTMDDFSAYGSIAVVDTDADGAPEWLLIGNYGGYGLIGRDHRVRWWRAAPLSSATCSFAGIADVDGDGLPEIGVATADGDFVCLRAATGAELWRLHLAQTVVGVSTCDIDGDGAAEFVVSTAEGTLMAIGVSGVGTGLIKWRLEFDYALGLPIIADFDGIGRSQILVVGGDGWLYSIDEG